MRATMRPTRGSSRRGSSRRGSGSVTAAAASLVSIGAVLSLLSLLSLLASPPLIHAAFAGNRTHYPDMTPRNGSATADPSFRTSGKGAVRVLALARHAPSSALLDIQTQWAAAVGVSITYSYLPEPASTAEYIAAVQSVCAASPAANTTASGNAAAAFDVLWMDITLVGVLEQCLLDLWAWDDTIGSDTVPAMLSSGSMRSKLLAMPALVDTSLLVYNKRYLSSHGYDDPPSSLDEMEEMLQSILVNERAAENYKLVGYTSSFSRNEDWMLLASDWIAGANGSIIDTRGRITVADSDFALALSKFVTWLNLGIMDIADIEEFGPAEALERFTGSLAVFLHTTSAVAGRLRDVGFDLGVVSVPALLPAALAGNAGTGVIGGMYMGVAKTAANPAAAVRVVDYLTSQSYQRRVFASDADTASGLVPTYSALCLDPAIAALQETTCRTHKRTLYTQRPTTLSSHLYPNVSALVAATLSSVFRGSTDILTALDTLDLDLRLLLGKPPRNATDVDMDPPPVVTKPAKKRLKYLDIQLAGLAAVSAISITVILLYRRKTLLENEAAERARLAKAGGTAVRVATAAWMACEIGSDRCWTRCWTRCRVAGIHVAWADGHGGD
ncbi:hypothetical protein BC831DRAFT_426362 [Entophlyctis helioformis]|nr:hypothetical protein BC831DRAFT_426362 [Entophlyctis helioformis]